MAAYWIARAIINDPVEYGKYAERIPGILAKYDAKILARGGESKNLEGPDEFERYVVIEFPTMDAAEACFNSAEYQEAAVFRRTNQAGRNELTIVAGA